MSHSAKQILGPDGAIARGLGSYEHRPQQLQMAEAVERAIHTKRHLAVEAGTGTGKSLAYLTPFAVWTAQNRKRVLIATHTKALQQQLFDKDLPFLKESTGIDFQYALCVGSRNYFCLRRLRSLDQLALLTSESQVEELDKIREWSQTTSTGLVFDLPFNPSPEVWNLVSRESDLCFGPLCEHFHDCHYYAARRFQQKAQILVANHHLFFANMAAAWRVLPEMEAVVFDEAQGLEEIASDYLGVSVSNTQVEFYLNSLHNARTDKGLLSAFPVSQARSQAVQAIAKALHAARELFENVEENVGDRDSTVRVRRAGLVENVLLEPMDTLVECLEELVGHAKSEERELELQAHVGRGKELSYQVGAFLDQSLEDQVYWVETGGRRRKRLTLKIAPIDLSEVLREGLFDKLAPIVLTSATLSTAGSFTFFRSRLGLEAADELSVGSPFDFEHQVLMYLPDDLPDPSAQYEAFNRAAAARAAEICRLSGGRAFVLFTSYRALNQAKEYFEEHLPHLTLLCQGEEPMAKLVSEFRRDESSVLLGTNTFWQGIDVPGDALQCVVVTKLPFAVPDHPLIEARAERIEEQNGNAFYEYQVPKAIIMFRQGFGRLIRTRTDYGVFALLDPRVRTKSYGDLFRKSLPQCETTHEMWRISSFLGQWRERKPTEPPTELESVVETTPPAPAPVPSEAPPAARKKRRKKKTEVVFE